MPAINQKVIGELRALQNAGSPGFLAELIDLFLRETETQLVKLRESYASRDAKVFERIAHTLKGGCGNLGAQAMCRMCSDLQTIGHAADWPRAEALLPGLESEFQTVKIELESEKLRG